MNFEKIKELLKEAIDEGNTIAEIMQITAEKIYQSGYNDGVNRPFFKDGRGE